MFGFTMLFIILWINLVYEEGDNITWIMFTFYGDILKYYVISTIGMLDMFLGIFIKKSNDIFYYL
jgi:hypothetical protein